MFCQFLSWGQLLLIPLDISNDLGTDPTMPTIYAAVYIIIFIFTSFIIPFNMFLYESDEEDSFISRVLWSGLFALAICASWSAFVFVSYIWLSKYTTPEGVESQIPVTMYMMISMALIGWVFLALNAGVGLVYLPYELIRDFFIRPKQITSEQAFQEKRDLQTRSD